MSTALRRDTGKRAEPGLPLPVSDNVFNPPVREPMSILEFAPTAREDRRRADICRLPVAPIMALLGDSPHNPLLPENKKWHFLITNLTIRGSKNSHMHPWHRGQAVIMLFQMH